MIEKSAEEYKALREDATVVSKDEHGDKVLLLADGTYLKLFRIKRLLTSARINPYWRRFVDNAGRLQQLGIPTVNVIDVFKIPAISRTGVHYRPLPGASLREIDALDESLVESLGRFIGELHDKGVYLRSMHLGNVVKTPEGDLGLIDIADMKTRRGPLSLGMRLRNFRHLARYSQDRGRISPHLDKFVSASDDRVREKLRQLFNRPPG